MNRWCTATGRNSKAHTSCASSCHSVPATCLLRVEPTLSLRQPKSPEESSAVMIVIELQDTCTRRI